VPLTPALLELLTRATADPRVSLAEADALALARQYGARGVRVKPSALSLRLADAVTGDILPADVKQAETRLARQLRTHPATLGQRLVRASNAERQRHSDALQDAFERDARRLASELATSGDVATWQRKMGARVIQHLVEQRTLGAARPLRDSERRQMAATVREQTAYLSRFADEVAVRALQGKPLSEAAIAQRAAQYGGVGRAAFYTGMEGSATTQRGYVARYRSVDSPTTCSRCHAAEGYYLVGSGPLPGEVCLGRHRCRCQRIIEYNPEIYDKLLRQARIA